MTASDSQLKLVSLSAKQFAGTITGLQMILLLSALDQTIITTAMPRIVAELGGFSRYAWATTAYLLTSTIAVPISGRLSDTFGRKPLMLIGLSSFIVASLLCGCAGMPLPMDGMTQLILARALQGIGGGIMLALIFIVIADILAPADRGRYQGHFAAVFAIASIFGPVLGGWVADKFSWRWLFYINLPLGLLAMAIFVAAFPRVHIAKAEGKLDRAGILVFSGMLLSLLLGLSWTAEHGLGDARVPISLAIALVAGVAFVPIELRAQQPLMPIALFIQPIIAISSFSLFVTGIGMFGSVLLIPLFLQTVMGVSAAASGALLTPLILTVAVTSIVGGQVISHTKRYKGLILFGLLLMTAGVFALSRIGSNTPITAIISYMLMVGTGMGLLLPVYPIVIQNAVPQDKVGTVTGFSQFFRSIGGTLGVAAFGSAMLTAYHQHLHKLLPAGIPANVLQLVGNPLEPNKMRLQLSTILPANSPLSADGILDVVKQSLVGSITNVFFFYAGLLTIVLIINLWLEEKKLRQASASDVRVETV